MNKKNSYIFVLIVSGLTLLVLGDCLKGTGSAKLLSESMSNSLVGGPPTGCKHKCENGSCCDDSNCDQWNCDQETCDGSSGRYNTNGKADWVCKPDDDYGDCSAKAEKEDCAESKCCTYDVDTDICEPDEEVWKTWNEAMKCTDDDGDHES